MQLLDILLDRSRTYDLEKHDYRVPAKSLALNVDARVQMPSTQFGDVPPLAPTEWAWKQMFRKLGPSVFGRGSKRTLPSNYLLAISKDLLAENINRHLEQSKSRWTVRGYKDSCRAVLDATYASVSNTEVLEATQTALCELDAVSSVRPHLTVDYLHGRIGLKDTGENYSIGFAFRNGEIGNSALSLSPFIQRNSCANSVIWGTNGLRMIHRGNSRSIMIQFKAAIANALPMAAEMVDKMLEAESEELDITAIIRGLAKEHGWSDDITDTVLVGTEGQETKAGLVNGVSYAAHTAVEEPSDQYDMEVLAGGLLLR